MSTLTTPKGFIARSRVQKVLTIILHTSQVTQATSLHEAKPKRIYYIGCDMAIIFSIHALHLGRVVSD